MTIRKVHLLIFLVMCCHLTQPGCLVFAGWFGNKNAAPADQPSEPQHKPVNKMRGITDAKANLYFNGGSIFRCFDGRGEIPVSSVNDGYCDCSDFSDEPGTSACPNSHFSCTNSGYRVIGIPSSRVDDGICDCCDGSDEGHIKRCPNTCEAIAKAERAEFERLSKDFKAGYAQREGYIQKMMEKKTVEQASLPSLESKLEDLKSELDILRSSKESEEKLQGDTKMEMIKKISDDTLQIIGAHVIEDISDALMYLRSVMDVLALTAENLKEVSEGGTMNIIAKSDYEENVNGDEDSDEPVGDYEDHPSYHHYDDYEEGYSEHGAVGDEDTDSVGTPDDNEATASGGDQDESQEDSTTDTVEDSEPKRTSCSLGPDHSLDLRLEALCSQPDEAGCVGSMCVYDVSLSKVRFFLSQVVLDRHQSKVLEILAGYYLVHRTFDGFDSFADELEAAVGGHIDDEVKSCPESFAPYPEACVIGEELKRLANEQVSAKVYTRSEAIAAKTKFTDHEEVVRKAEEEVNNKKSYIEETEKYKDYLEFLAVKDQCYEVKDGKFMYSLCMLRSLHQTDTENKGKVSLGNYRELAMNEDGTYQMSFTDGQNCWNVGPRKASVKISCGAVNQLSDATEVSTCVYTFDLISPAACSKRWGQLQGVLEN